MTRPPDDAAPPSRPVRVAMCGTFDVRNFGDLLFPLVLRHELCKRVPGLQVECFSYHSKTTPGWPYAVSPVSTLPDVIHSIDGVVIGGGHLIRFDKEVASGYFPPSAELHHPTSYWLYPAMLAIEAKLPLIWSAVGASPDLPSWGCELLRAVLPASSYISARDPETQRTLQPLAGDREVRHVPDTVFGLPGLHLHDPREASGRYVVIQASHHLKPHVPSLKGLLLWLDRQGYETVLLPVAPALGDDAAALHDIAGRTAKVCPWTHPAEAVTLIANAAAVVGPSLHLTISALAFGVPALRPFGNALSKYYSVHDLPGVFALEDYASRPERFHHAVQGEKRKSPEIQAFRAELDAHWDTIGRILTAPAPKSPGLASLFRRLPFLLERG